MDQKSNLKAYHVGDIVSYGLHGKCVITGIETKDLPSGSVDFYQIRTVKASPKHLQAARAISHKDPFILIPVENAELRGLRPLMTKEHAEEILKRLSGPPESEEEFEIPGESWIGKQKRLEEIIRKEGSTGLARVVGYLFVYLKQDAVPPTAILRFYENVYRILSRELAEALGLSNKDFEPILQKTLRNKLTY